MDDINALKIYEKFNKTILTMIITGSIDRKLAQKAKQIAGISYIEKSFGPEMFKEKIINLLQIQDII